jgi:hypothetical protein
VRPCCARDHLSPSLCFAGTSFVFGLMLDKYGPRVTSAVGHVILIGGMLLFGFTTNSTSWDEALPALCHRWWRSSLSLSLRVACRSLPVRSGILSHRRGKESHCLRGKTAKCRAPLQARLWRCAGFDTRRRASIDVCCLLWCLFQAGNPIQLAVLGICNEFKENSTIAMSINAGCFAGL